MHGCKKRTDVQVCPANPDARFPAHMNSELITQLPHELSQAHFAAVPGLLCSRHSDLIQRETLIGMVILGEGLAAGVRQDTVMIRSLDHGAAQFGFIWPSACEGRM